MRYCTAVEEEVNMTINPVLATVTNGFIPAASSSGDKSVPAAIPAMPSLGQNRNPVQQPPSVISSDTSTQSLRSNVVCPCPALPLHTCASKRVACASVFASRRSSLVSRFAQQLPPLFSNWYTLATRKMKRNYPAMAGGRWRPTLGGKGVLPSAPAPIPTKTAIKAY
jgi:hypothetical protein